MARRTDGDSGELLGCIPVIVGLAGVPRSTTSSRCHLQVRRAIDEPKRPNRGCAVPPPCQTPLVIVAPLCSSNSRLPNWSIFACCYVVGPGGGELLRGTLDDRGICRVTAMETTTRCGLVDLLDLGSRRPVVEPQIVHLAGIEILGASRENNRWGYCRTVGVLSRV